DHADALREDGGARVHPAGHAVRGAREDDRGGPDRGDRAVRPRRERRTAPAPLSPHRPGPGGGAGRVGAPAHAAEPGRRAGHPPGSGAMNLHRLLVAAYGMLLWVFPRHHRDRYGREILDAFGRELVAVRERAGAAAALRFALRGFLDAVLAGAGERRRAARERRAGRELGLGPDLRHAVRSLARSWGYTLVCLFSLASGLGVTAAVMLLY